MRANLAPRHVIEGAQATLEQIDGALAVVLFGSRARDDWRDDSDWDLAVITTSGEGVKALADDSAFDAARQDGCEVNCLVVPEAKIAEKRRYLGGFWRAVVRDGVVIAGEWQDQHKRERLLMDTNIFLRHLEAAYKRMVAGARSYGLIGRGGRPSFVDDADCSEFVSLSADAAERLAKAMLISLGIDPVKTHDMISLASQAEEAGHANEASMIRALNGHVKVDHVAHYEFDDDAIERLENAAQRFVGVMTLYDQVIRSLPKAVTESEREYCVARAREVFEEIASCFRRADDAGAKVRAPNVAALLKYQDELSQTAGRILETRR